MIINEKGYNNKIELFESSVAGIPSIPRCPPVNVTRHFTRRAGPVSEVTLPWSQLTSPTTVRIAPPILDQPPLRSDITSQLLIPTYFCNHATQTIFFHTHFFVFKLPLLLLRLVFLVAIDVDLREGEHSHSFSSLQIEEI